MTPQVGNQCEEGFTLDQAGVATVAFSSNISRILEAHAEYGITSLYTVHDTFFENGVGLRKDWELAWARLQVELEPLVARRAVFGFFVGDELFPGKISLADFTTCIRALQIFKDAHSALGLVTWENEGGTGWIADFAKTGIPKELDVISMDDYYMWGWNGTDNRGPSISDDTPQRQVEGHRKFYEHNIYPLLKPHQRVFIVPGSFGTRDTRQASATAYPRGNRTYCYNGTVDGCDVYMAEQARAYGAWAMQDARVSGLFPWHWDTRQIGVVTPYKEVGVVDMPKTKAAWRQIGEMFAESGGSARGE